jgi:hypothetical protein
MQHVMRKLIALVGASAGGWLGWVLGAGISLLLAFVLSMVGTGIGMYVASRWARQYW